MNGNQQSESGQRRRSLAAFVTLRQPGAKVESARRSWSLCSALTARSEGVKRKTASLRRPWVHKLFRFSAFCFPLPHTTYYLPSNIA